MRKGICKSRKLLQEGMCYKIGNDQMIKATLGPWFPGMKNFIPKLKTSMVLIIIILK